MKKFRLLDLFCGAGGAGEGYRRAGFEVTGVDSQPQKHYRAGRFIQADALAYVAQYGWMYDAIHASPPCQSHSVITPDKSKHEDLIPQTQFWLRTLGLPYVIENVSGARKYLRNPIMICGADLGLRVYRHRFFESNLMLLAMKHKPHKDGSSDETPHAARRRSGTYGISKNGFVSVTGHFSGIDYCRNAMGIDWMTASELSQAIPPAYTEFIGRQMLTYLTNSMQIEAVTA